MKVFSSAQVKSIDRFTILNEPVSSIKLMERASMKFTQWFIEKFPEKPPVMIIAGTGNNGGDALAIARLLIERNYKVRVFQTGNTNLSEDCAKNLLKLRSYIDVNQANPEIFTEKDFFIKGEVVIDGIFGSGLNRPIDGKTAQLIKNINQNAETIVSIDIPSGLFGEDNRNNIPDYIIKASYTITFEFPFLSFFMSENERYVGEWIIVPIGLHPEVIENTDTAYETLDDVSVRKLLIPRNKYSHKGNYGHALIIAGRYGMMGAAVLATKACMRGGAGLTSVVVPDAGNQILQTSAPEAISITGMGDVIIERIPHLSYQAIGVGPGIGLNVKTKSSLHELIKKSKVPLVIDADAITVLSQNKDWIDELPEGSVITPHPGEFDRLAERSEDMYSRHLKQLEFTAKYNIIVVLKGAHTIVTLPGGQSYINTTGNPGMATGGSGDVLTGLITSLIAQGYKPSDACLIAVFIHGRAGDLALDSSSVEALIAGDLIEKIGEAFKTLKNDNNKN